MKKCAVERTNKTEIRPAEHSEKTESFRENVWNEIQLKGPYRQKKTQEQNKKEWASSVGSSTTLVKTEVKLDRPDRLVQVKDINHNIPTT